MTLSRTRAAQLRHALRQVRGAMTSLSVARTRYAKDEIVSCWVRWAQADLSLAEMHIIQAINIAQERTQDTKRRQAA